MFGESKLRNTRYDAIYGINFLYSLMFHIMKFLLCKLYEGLHKIISLSCWSSSKIDELVSSKNANQKINELVDALCWIKNTCSHSLRTSIFGYIDLRYYY